jgi:ferredoxin
MSISREAGGKTMKNTIFYYTGTGNSLWVARTLAEALGDTELISIADWGIEKRTIDSDAIGFVFPVHIWGVPGRIIEFIDEVELAQPGYVFAVAVNAGQAASTLVQLKNILKKKNLPLSSGFSIPLVSNYIPWGGPGPKSKQSVLFESAREKILKIAVCMRNREQEPVEKGPFWLNPLLTLLYKMSFNRVPTMDKQFWADEKCNQCGICGKVCPSENITMQEGKPVWNRRCEQCFACLQWCPKKAIQYGKRTAKYVRYHHPEVQLKDVLKQRPSPE